MPPAPNLQAGAARVEITPPAGVPLAGYSGRRASAVDLDPSNYVTFFKPSTGVRDPLYARAIALSDGKRRVVMVSIDAIAIIEEIIQKVVADARALGSSITEDELLIFASHSHSGAGAMTSLKFWQLAATDVLVKSVRDDLAHKCAEAIVAAEKAMAPARLGTGSGELFGATHNRRAGVSPNATADTIDPFLGVIRVDKADGSPLALVWNFAIHGTALGTDNLAFSADVMGGVSSWLETNLGAFALFANSAEGDIAPKQDGEAGIATLGPSIGQKAKDVYDAIQPSPTIVLDSSSAQVDFGQAAVKLSTASLSSGELDLKGLASGLGWNPTATQPLGADWVDHSFRFQAVRLNDDVIASVPGEAIHVLGKQIRDAGKALGFQRVFVFGLANGHMSYVTDETEYNVGGYEALATFFGPKTGEKLVTGCTDRMRAVKP